MSTLPSSDNAKQPPSVYTVMLVMSMVFLLIAVIAMFVEYRRWAPDHWRTQTARPTAAVIVDANQYA
ncbi:hypothetical protein [Roseiconus lacunae]|uniref:Uncharacterized protein n=1 Tax=Roseiconus lacunae TaxID=2605694 RepID=A0ABT7PJ68_9BACT|nr:hypothetical protein [Roseiconus lacunae]MCD0461812.1 hypothetical protein [Roseiconus lacunae]MDM4016545.1 hypothetical protein [Roseiconus lacunae]WRQ49414.1 hypothetical protein U8335_20955 [Stieleria sp. HD01]